METAADENVAQTTNTSGEGEVIEQTATAENIDQATTINNVQEKNETQEFNKCAQAYKSTGAIHPGEEGLNLTHALVDCAENYLASFPQGPHVKEIEQLRFYSIYGGMQILRELDQNKTATESTSVGDVQQKLISRKNIEEMRGEHVNAINRALDDMNIKIAWQLFNNLKSSGISMEDVDGTLNPSNAQRRNTGVWEITVDDSYDANRFVVLREWGERYPWFVLSGFGLVNPHIKLDDDGFEKRGWFTSSCNVRVFLESKSFEHNCADYLSGKASTLVLDEITKTLTDAMREKEASPK